jgi:two-component system, NtrC family, sensor kinase
VHPLLATQLQERLGTTTVSDPALAALTEDVSRAYESYETVRALLEGALESSSREARARYEALQQDVAERRRAEHERDAFFHVSNDLLAVLDGELKLTQTNPAWTHLLGYPPDALTGKKVTELLHPDDASVWLQIWKEALVEGRPIVGLENRLRTARGEYRWVAWVASLDPRTQRCFAGGRDITEKRLMELELAQAQKMEAVGTLASGVAHEINNPVQYIGDNLTFLRESFRELGRLHALVLEQLEGGRLERDALQAMANSVELGYLSREIPSALEEALDGVKRVAELVRALKEFAHPDQGDMTATDLNRCLQRTVTVARNELKYVSDVVFELGELPTVDCHQGAINQVFLNLLINAAHAIEDRQKAEGGYPHKGRITIATRVEGSKAVVAITDTGTGIPEQVRSRIFDPFFTTKEVGRGSGQGLPISRSIVVDKHGGTLDFVTTLGEGTTFFVRLPLEQHRLDTGEQAA